MTPIPSRRTLLALLLAPAFAAARAQGRPAFDTAALMALLAQTKEGKASFTEERHVNGFDAPLITRGELHFKAPDVFERRTLSPSAESLLVRGNQMTLQRGNQRRSLALDASPEAAAIVGAIRGTLTGDQATLDAHFKLGLSGREGDWLLDLVPRDAQLMANVRNVQMRGSAGVVRVIEVWFASGDHAVTKIVPID